MQRIKRKPSRIFQKTSWIGILTVFLLCPVVSEAAQGDLQWAVETGGRVVSTPSISSEGTLYAGSGDKRLYAIQADGTVRWTFLTGGLVYSSPAVGLDNTVYVGSGDHKLYAVNPDGTLKWTLETGASVESSPAVGPDGTIFVGSYDKNLYAINPDGTIKWTFATGDYIYSSPAIGADGTVYVGSADRKLYAIGSDGALIWSFETGDYVSSSPAIGSEGMIYVGSRDGYLYAIDDQGIQQWVYPTEGRVASSPAIGADGTIYVGSADRKLYAVNADGTLRWSFETGRAVESSPAVGADGTIYVGSQDGKLYAINADGTLRWSFETGNWVQSSAAINEDGTIYIGSHDHKLYAIEGASAGLVESPWPKFRHDARGTGVWTLVTDTDPPSVSGTDPARDALNVDVDTTITATFSEAMDPASITSGTFLVSQGGGIVSGTVNYSGLSAVFTPDAALDYDASYQATITVSARDLAGNHLTSNHVWSFWTQSNPDAVPPVINATNPADGATDVGVGVSIMAQFSEAVDPATVTGATFLVSHGAAPVAGTIACDGATATFVPTVPLDYNTAYTVSITTGVQDLAGNALEADYSWSFSTEQAPDITPPAVESTSPAHSAADVGIAAAMAVTFSEDMNPSSIDGTTFFVDGGAGHIAGTVSANGRIAVFTPAAVLDYATLYTATVTTGVTDTAGNALEGAYIWTFTTEDPPPPVISVSPTAISKASMLGENPPSDSLEVWNTGGGALEYAITDDAQWLSCDPSAGMSEGEHDGITIHYAISGLSAGTYSAAISIHAVQAANSPLSIPVTLVIGSHAPVADAGPDQRVVPGDTVILDGSNSSDPDDGIASYLWAQTAGRVVAISDQSAVKTSFVAPEEDGDGVSLTFRLTVTDNGGSQSSDTCIVNVTSSNEPPLADAGPDQQVGGGDLVTLSAGGSTDSDGVISAYRWMQIWGDPVTLSDQTAVEPTFAAPEQEDGRAVIFELTVTDNGGLQSSDTCIVNVSNSNTAPTADTGPAQDILEGATVTLDGSNSSDSDGEIMAYRWAQTAGPPVALSVPGAQAPTFVAPPVGPQGTVLGFRLTVTDDAGLRSGQETTITVNDNGITGFPDGVTTFVTTNGDDMGMQVSSGGQCVILAAVDPSTIAETSGRPQDLPYGLINMHIRTDTVGGAVDVTLYLPDSAPEDYAWYKYHSSWYDYSTHSIFNSDRSRVTLTLVDGGDGDDDQLANGIIVDPSGLGSGSTSSPPPPVQNNTAGGPTDNGGAGGGGGGCFIGMIQRTFF
ncbi:MAG: PQQ-binding-like beta-propeller repeat protein [Deltaproteobacteria bacterium]|nr:PQQ-binding-like beta-propeller repeat protein [Deltaproteobacteria bacterium]